MSVCRNLGFISNWFKYIIIFSVSCQTMADDGPAEDYPTEIEENLNDFDSSVSSVENMVQTLVSVSRSDHLRKVCGNKCTNQQLNKLVTYEWMACYRNVWIFLYLISSWILLIKLNWTWCLHMPSTLCSGVRFYTFMFFLSVVMKFKRLWQDLTFLLSVSGDTRSQSERPCDQTRIGKKRLPFYFKCFRFKLQVKNHQ